MSFLDTIIETGVFARITHGDVEEMVAAARTLIEQGLRGVALCCTSPAFAPALRQLRADHHDEALIGVSYLGNVDLFTQAKDAGAQFAFSPHFDPELMANAIVEGIPLIAGGISPTEMVQAWDSGAAAIHVFPARFINCHYLEAVHQSLPHIPLVPSHGIDIENMAEWFAAGAAAVCIDDGLTDGSASDIAKHARKAVEMLHAIRSE